MIKCQGQHYKVHIILISQNHRLGESNPGPPYLIHDIVTLIVRLSHVWGSPKTEQKFKQKHVKFRETLSEEISTSLKGKFIIYIGNYISPSIQRNFHKFNKFPTAFWQCLN